MLESVLVGSLEEARTKIKTSGIDYNDSRPHQGLKEMAPTEYALKSRSIEKELVHNQAKGYLRK
jgi:Integrase core domain